MSTPPHANRVLGGKTCPLSPSARAAVGGATPRKTRSLNQPSSSFDRGGGAPALFSCSSRRWAVQIGDSGTAGSRSSSNTEGGAEPPSMSLQPWGMSLSR
eukprot:scaffold3829_cov73-Isochrysis_galbana.AAC.1